MTAVTIIDLERGLRSWGDAATYHRYLHKFADAHGHDGDEIAALIAQGAPESARALAHKLKGTAGNLAIMAIWELAEKIEQMLTERTDASDWPQKLQRALDGVLDEIKSLGKSNSSNDRAISCVTDSNAPLQLLRELLLALDRDSPDEAEPSLLALEKILPMQMLEPIREMLDNFDFRSAEAQANALIKHLNISLEEL